jgi:hypothetical protein
MENNDKVWPMTGPFADSPKGQVSYASMIGSIFLHFVVGSDTQMKLGWDRWKATYYIIPAPDVFDFGCLRSHRAA